MRSGVSLSARSETAWLKTGLCAGSEDAASKGGGGLESPTPRVWVAVMEPTQQRTLGVE